MAATSLPPPGDPAVPEGAGTPLSPSTGDTTLSDVLLTLRKWKWVVLGVVLLAAAWGFYKAFTQPVLYTATSRIQVGSSESTAYRLPGAGADQNLSDELLILHSDSLLLKVAREMDLANNPVFLNGPAPFPRRDISRPDVRQTTVNHLGAVVSVAIVPTTQILTISAVTGGAQLSTDIVNRIVDDYITRSFETRFAATQRVSTWLSGQLDELKQGVERSQRELIDMQKKVGVLGLTFDSTHPMATDVTTRVDALATASSNARIARILAESRYRTLQETPPNHLEDTVGGAGGELGRLRSDLATARALLAQDSVRLGEKNPKVQEDEARIREIGNEADLEQGRILNQARDAFLAAQANEQETLNALNQAKNEAYQMRDSLVEFTLKQRDYETNRLLYDTLLGKLRAAGVQAGLDATPITIIDKAELPAAPTLRPRGFMIIQSTGFGLIAGIVLAFLLESLDTGLRTVAEVETFLQLPSLAVIPRIRRGTTEGTGLTVAQANINVLATNKSQFAEAFRSLRTSLLLATTGHPPKILALTSATPSEGKTTVSTNLACILAQRETPVLLIDCDMRRPSVHHRFGLDGQVGLSTVLSGNASIESAVRQVPESPNLDILCCGPIPPFPTEMLSSAAMVELLAKASERYTHIVLDSPPILSVTDGVLLSRYSDALAIVVRQGKISRNVVRRARDLLVRAGAPVTGIVLNGVDLRNPEYYGYYGYSSYGAENDDSNSWHSGSKGGGNGKSRRPSGSHSSNGSKSRRPEEQEDTSREKVLR